MRMSAVCLTADLEILETCNENKVLETCNENKVLETCNENEILEVAWSQENNVDWTAGNQTE
jgi:hypothetical protein